jgi:hypothetical protein
LSNILTFKLAGGALKRIAWKGWQYERESNIYQKRRVEKRILYLKIKKIR